MGGIVFSSGIDALVNPKGHATTASPAMFEVIGDLADSPNKATSVIGQDLIAIVRGGAHFGQSRRSRLSECTPVGALFACVAGKLRKDGRPPHTSFSCLRGAHVVAVPGGCVRKYCQRLQRLYEGGASCTQSALWLPSASVYSALRLWRAPMTLGAVSAQLFSGVAFGSSERPALDELAKPLQLPEDVWSEDCRGLQSPLA